MGGLGIFISNSLPEHSHLLQHAQVNVKCQLGLELIRQQAQGGVDVAAALDAATWPAVVVPPQHSPFHPSGDFVVAHVSLGTVEQPFELKAISVTVRYHISDLTDDRCEYEYAN